MDPEGCFRRREGGLLPLCQNAVVGVREAPGGAIVEVRVRPRSRPGVEMAGETIVVRVGAPPVEGRANEEARRVLAEALGVPPSRVRLVRGRRSRAKAFAIEGLDAAAALPALRRAAGR